MISDFITSDIAINAAGAFVVAGLVLAFIAIRIPPEKRLLSGLFVGQAAALGVLAGSILGMYPTGAGSLVAASAVVLVLILIRFGTRVGDAIAAQELYQVGFFLAAASMLIAETVTNYEHPRLEQLLFGHLFTVSGTELMTLAGVSWAVIALLWAVRRFLRPSPGIEESVALLLMAGVSGLVVSLTGIVPFTALLVLPLIPNPANPRRPTTSTFLVAAFCILASGIGGVFFSRLYGLPGAASAVGLLSGLALLRIFVNLMSPKAQ